MDGRNCNGRTISLLNDSSEVAAFPAKIQLPPLIAHSRASSSCASTPSLSPQTPQLSRSSSSDSRGFTTPHSPLTPSGKTFDYHPQHTQQHHQHHQYFIGNGSKGKMDDQHASMYPPIPDATGVMPPAYPMPPQLAPQLPPQPNAQVYRSSNSPSSEPSRVSTVSATSNPKSTPKKNQYPCPMAKQVGCTDFFTTSGHAARHAKKHTGKKDAFCPECNKAFTRKDNMEQHRRTHQNGRSNSRSSNGDEPKVKKSTKQPAKKSAIKAEPEQFEAAVEQQLAEQQQQQQMMPPALQAQMVAASVPMPNLQPLAIDQAMMVNPAVGAPYFLPTVDSGPVPPLPMAMPNLDMRPPLQRSTYTTNVEFMQPLPAAVPDPDHYSYPSPGLSNGLNNLALAASEHRRLSEEKSQSQSPREISSHDTP